MNVGDERIRSIILGPSRAFRVLAFPGRSEVRIAVRALSEREIDACRIEGQRQFLDLCRARGWDPEKAINIDPLMHSRLVERQIVWRAFFDADTIASSEPRPFFPSDSDVAELDSITTTDLVSAYAEHQEFVSPSRGLSPEEVERIIDAMGKASDPGLVLRTIERDSLVSLALTMVRRLSISPTGR